jgi:SWI/SNF-related matrix-associated actin-dependent regulator of chromatin subfamily A-like protein 1
MKITVSQSSSRKPVFVAESSYEEKNSVKAAGFWWHPGNGSCGRQSCLACDARIGKTWWTPFAEKAVRLIEYADEAAKAALEKTVEAIEGSKASSAPAENIPVPAGLAYLPFQAAGIAYAEQRPATLIADEMGLGKTIQAIGVMNMTHPKSVLVICPASLRINWGQRELPKWLVDKHEIYVVESNDPIPQNATIVVCNYDRLKNGVLETLMTRSWDLVVLDEAHYIKNPKCQRSKALLGVPAHKEKGVLVPAVRGILDQCERKLFLTGTPILNKPIELQPILAKISPREFGSFFTFAKRYCNAQETKYGWNFSGASHLDELQTRLRANCMVRRLKKDVLTELPAKRRQVIELPVEDSAVKRALKAENDAYADCEDELQSLQETADLAKALGSAEAYKTAISKLQETAKIAFENMSSERRNLALAKVPAVIDHIQSVLESGVEKLIVFCHHIDVLNAMKKELGDQAVVFYGNTSPEDRQKAVDRFQTDPACKVFIGTIKAAGVGLTLTAASHVIFVELDWVPANMFQAEDRAHRIGQMQSVLIQHLVVNGSLDARMAHILVAKQDIADKALDNDVFVVVPPPVEKKRQSPAVYPKASPEARKLITDGIRCLSNMCDGAVMQDESGFNRLDTGFGHVLAERAQKRELSDGELWAAAKLCVKYGRQLADQRVEAARELLGLN